ncbi:ferredoxin [Candidatus Woesearchaeota archaeon]|jgi:ferredoxin|nr:ferredoxin [Candidatus Woesearchaeota archaeon]
MAKYKIVHNRDMCIGCGMCAKVCDNWEMKDDGKSSAKNTELAELGTNQDAVDQCPVSCISIEEQ